MRIKGFKKNVVSWEESENYCPNPQTKNPRDGSAMPRNGWKIKTAHKHGGLNQS